VERKAAVKAAEARRNLAKKAVVEILLLFYYTKKEVKT
jgi:tRNA threonylcarbamoyladenosine modification (KEOPS) complex Cgi121 subunit